MSGVWTSKLRAPIEPAHPFQQRGPSGASLAADALQNRLFLPL